MKKKTLKLDELKVKSFITEQDKAKVSTIRGGIKITFACTKAEKCNTGETDCGGTQLEFCDDIGIKQRG
ncbi:MAG: pinensin family lanthipeptide [Bacteroidota bacterium]